MGKGISKLAVERLAFPIVPSIHGEGSRSWGGGARRGKCFMYEHAKLTGSFRLSFFRRVDRSLLTTPYME